MPYSIHEPAPTHLHHLSFGRGGIGNRTRPLPPSTIKDTTFRPQQPQSTHNYSTGRGGVGNISHAPSDRRIFSFDEELAKQGKVSAAPVYHIGRGGQGNMVQEVEMGRRESDARSSSSGSGSSKGSVADGDRGGKRGSLEWMRGLVGGKS